MTTDTPPIRVLVVGSGAREHAVVRALSDDPFVEQVYVSPGNPGMATDAQVEVVDATDAEAIAALAVRLAVDLVVVGPESALVAGVADAVTATGVACFGPTAAAARIEGSKSFAKEVMAEAGVPTARSLTCKSREEVEDALAVFGPPFVVKDDCLAAGKGGETVVVEEFLEGPEVSLLVVTDGRDVVPLPLAQDYKRLGDGDVGPNTGGMGAYAPVPWTPPHLTDDIVRDVARPVLQALADRGTPFVGVLYIGLALTPSGPKVIEFNARLGDPEAQVLLPLLASSPGRLLMAAATGRLAQIPAPRWRPGACVAVVVATGGYPYASRSGDVVHGADGPGYLHAGTRATAAGQIVTSGGRAVCCVGVGDTLAQARIEAYTLVEGIGIAGGVYRTDIAESVGGPS